MVKRFLLILTLVTGFLVAAGPAPAQAVITCPSGKFCTYWDVDFGGNMYYYSPTVGSHCVDIGAPWDNNITSVKNNSIYNLRMYYLHGCTGTLGPEIYAHTGGNLSRLDNDVISSFYWQEGS